MEEIRAFIAIELPVETKLKLTQLEEQSEIEQVEAQNG